MLELSGSLYIGTIIGLGFVAIRWLLRGGSGAMLGVPGLTFAVSPRHCRRVWGVTHQAHLEKGTLVHPFFKAP